MVSVVFHKKNLFSSDPDPIFTVARNGNAVALFCNKQIIAYSPLNGNPDLAEKQLRSLVEAADRWKNSQRVDNLK